jgi:predicted nucleic acid-binding protein
VRRFVLDASVTLAWLIDRVIPPYALRVRSLLSHGARAVVPVLWRFEVANGLVVSERRGIHASADTAEILQELETVRVHSIEESQQAIPMRRTLATAREFRLSAYDASYLDLARGLELPLATLDRQLQDAAAKAGVPVVR